MYPKKADRTSENKKKCSPPKGAFSLLARSQPVPTSRFLRPDSRYIEPLPPPNGTNVPNYHVDKNTTSSPTCPDSFLSLSSSIPLAHSLSYLNKPVATKQILRLISAHFSAFFPFRSPKPFAVGLERRRLKNNVGRSRFGRQKLTLIERLFFLTSSKTASAFKLFFPFHFSR